MSTRRREVEPGGIAYDRYRVGLLLDRLRKRLSLKAAVEVPSSGAKACPSLYSLQLALGGCQCTLVNPHPPALKEWERLGVLHRATPVQTDVTQLPFARNSFGLAWNFVSLGWRTDMTPVLKEMARVAGAVLLVQQNGYNIGYPWHRFLHRAFNVVWDHGETQYFFPTNVKAAMEEAGLKRIEIGLLDQAPWPDPPGFRDIRLHLAGKRPHPEEDIDWVVPTIDYIARERFPAWMRFLGWVEDLPVPMALRWPVNHLFYALGFSR